MRKPRSQKQKEEDLIAQVQDHTPDGSDYDKRRTCPDCNIVMDWVFDFGEHNEASATQVYQCSKCKTVKAL